MKGKGKRKGKGKERVWGNDIRNVKYEVDKIDGMECEELELEGSLLVYDFLYVVMFLVVDYDFIEVDGEEGEREE